MDAGERTRIEDVMTAPVETISRTATVVEAARVMREHDISALLVPGSTTGIITSTDVLDAVATDEDLSGATVADLMTAPVETVTAQLRLEEAAAMMTNFGVKHLPVVDRDGEYVGMVSSTDLTEVLV